MTPETRRSAAGAGALALILGSLAAAVILTGGANPAGASTLERFGSCAELRGWVEETQVGREGDAVAVAVGAEAPMAAGARSSADASDSMAQESAAAPTAPASDAGVTNTVVEGVDEIDIVELLADGRALVARNGTLSLVDLARLQVLDSVGRLPADARVSVGGDVVWVAGSADDGTGVAVRRLRLAGDSLEEDGSWTTPGRLVDARRTGERLHVLATDEPFQRGVVPFQDGPVPCDQVWHPEGKPTTPAASLVATLPASGDLEPTATAAVVGSAAGFLVTETAAYVTTQSWEETVSTGVHRFALATLKPTGSGTVAGTVPGPFGLSEHEGHLRVATNAEPRFGQVRTMPAGPDIAVSSPPSVPERSTGGGLAEVFVLDLEGALDVVGKTGRFGHDGESIHGVRFVGDVAYVVTFLQTDPFFVLDLADPKSPKTVGELQIPGFSGYLHPVDAGRVVGFGPDGQGKVAARLFDVTNPAAPRIVDQLALGQDSPVVGDHHAFVGLDGGRFAVPVNEHPTVVRTLCVDPPPRPTPLPMPVPEPLPRPVEPDGGTGSGGATSSFAPTPDGSCQPVFEGGSSGVVVLRVEAGRLTLADRRATKGELFAERVLPVPGNRWVLMAGDRLVNPDGGELVLPQR